MSDSSGISERRAMRNYIVIIPKYVGMCADTRSLADLSLNKRTALANIGF